MSKRPQRPGFLPQSRLLGHRAAQIVERQRGLRFAHEPPHGVERSHALAEREAQVENLEEAHTALTDQNRMLEHAVATRESAHYDAQQKIREQSDLVELLEKQLQASRDATEMQIEQLQRERLERSMAEGALEAGRKDVARLLRELGAVQYRPLPAATGAEAAAGQRPLRSAA
jgi:septal ring factor EnvC (AmiA/AmiB activator)